MYEHINGDSVDKYYGIYRAVVKKIDDPQNLRRIQVVVPQITGEEVTEWIWPVYSTQKPPGIGSGVFIFYLGGDPEYPVWIGNFGSDGNGGGGGTNPPTGAFSYGAFHDETTQSVSGINTAKAINLGVTDLSSGISVVSGNQIKVDYDGVYNVQFSLQFHGLSGGGSGTTAQVWLDIDGTSVPQSNTKVSVNNNSPYVVAAWNFLVYIKAKHYCRLMWATDNTQIKIESSSASPGPNVPGTIVTVTQVA